MPRSHVGSLFSPAFSVYTELTQSRWWFPPRGGEFCVTIISAADRPARRTGSAHAKYYAPYHMVLKQFLLLGLAAKYRSRPHIIAFIWANLVQPPLY